MIQPGAIDALKKTLRKQVSERNFVFVGIGAHEIFETTHALLRAACTELREDEGYQTIYLRMGDLTKDNPKIPETFKVLVPKGVSYRDVWENREDILQNLIEDRSAKNL